MFVAFNLFDRRQFTGRREARLPDASLEEDNGFYLLWAFMEPPAEQWPDAACRAQIARLAGPDLSDADFRREYPIWFKVRRSYFQAHWKSFDLFFPRLPDEDVIAYFQNRREPIGQLQREYRPLLERWQKLLEVKTIEDFTAPGRDFPYNHFRLLTVTARLYVAGQALETDISRWPETADNLLRLIETGKKLIRSGRTLLINSLGKSLVDMGLRTLGSLLNQPQCPAAIAERILVGLTPLGYQEYGTGPVMDFNCLTFDRQIDRLKREGRVDPMLVKDFFRDPVPLFTFDRLVNTVQPELGRAINPLLLLMLKENETRQSFYDFWATMRRLEQTEPYRWTEADLEPVSRVARGPFWWLRNAMGKMMVQSAVPYQRAVILNYVYRSHLLKVRHELIRILAEFRSQTGLASPSPGGIGRWLSTSTQRDPFSGLAFRFSPAQGVIYSVGPDGRDGGGRETANFFQNSDIICPVEHR